MDEVVFGQSQFFKKQEYECSDACWFSGLKNCVIIPNVITNDACDPQGLSTGWD